MPAMTAPLEQALQCAAETAGTVAAQSEQRFNDMPTDHYAYEAIEWMVAQGRVALPPGIRPRRLLAGLSLTSIIPFIIPFI